MAAKAGRAGHQRAFLHPPVQTVAAAKGTRALPPFDHEAPEAEQAADAPGKDSLLILIQTNGAAIFQIAADRIRIDDQDRMSVVWVKSVSLRYDWVWHGISNKKKLIKLLNKL